MSFWCKRENAQSRTQSRTQSKTQSKTQSNVLAAETILPKIAVFEVTYRCPHRCAFCYCPWENAQDWPKDELSTAEVFSALEMLRRCGVRQVTFSGGEPTQRPDLRELLLHARSLGLHVGLISNGRVLDAEWLDFLRPLHVQLSLSVPGIETFEQTTGVSGVGHVLQLFSMAKERGIKTCANVTVSRTNLPELYENIAYPLIYGADYLLLNRFMPGGRGMQHTELLLNAEELDLMLETAEKVLSRAGKKGHVGTELPYCVLRDPKKFRFLQISSRCSAARYFCALDPGGWLKPCNHSPVRVCRFDEIPDQIPAHPYWKRFLESDYLPEMCTDCRHLSLCRGGCREAAHVFGGSLNSPDPLLADISKTRT